MRGSISSLQHRQPLDHSPEIITEYYLPILASSQGHRPYLCQTSIVKLHPTTLIVICSEPLNCYARPGELTFVTSFEANRKPRAACLSLGLKVVHIRPFGIWTPGHAVHPYLLVACLTRLDKKKQLMQVLYLAPCRPPCLISCISTLRNGFQSAPWFRKSQYRHGVVWY